LAIYNPTYTVEYSYGQCCDLWRTGLCYVYWYVNCVKRDNKQEHIT